MFDATISNMFSDKPSSIKIPFDNDEFARWYFKLSLTAKVLVYITFLGTLMFIMFLILKILNDCDIEDDTERQQAAAREERITVCTPLVNKPSDVTGNKDVETASFSSSEDLDYSTLCVICFVERRNCFFVPCGHSVTCRGCARKILSEGSKVCPICRRVIRKSRKLLLKL